MAGRQRHFELIPKTLVKSNGPKPPMTSKAAKKAHQLATRGPKVSKAEQRRRDAEELAKQKKEYEREKASARAKAARDKKAAKEQAEKDARKKKGIPEPSRFVRASQPTISRFVKNGNKNKWLEMDHVADESHTKTAYDEEVDQDMAMGPPAKKVKTGDESEDEYGGFPIFSQSELGTVLEDLDSSARSEGVQSDRIEFGRATSEALLELKSKSPSEIIPEKKSSNKFPWQSSENLDDMAATQLLSEAADTAACSARQQKPVKVETLPEIAPLRLVFIAKPTPSVPRGKHLHAFPKPVPTVRPALQERSINMPPPPLPLQTKQKRSISFAPSPPKPRVHPRSVLKPTLPPSATQSFLENHLDDFFPSPSQEIRELLDNVDDLPSNTQIARELEPSLPTTKALNVEIFADLMCTQDFVLSPQDILEITTPCPPPKPKTAGEQPESTPTPLPSKAAARQPRRRFFEEKDEDLLHAAIQESKTLAAQKEQKAFDRKSSARTSESKSVTAHREAGEPSGTTKRKFKRTLSNATDYGEDEFHDCEEELLAMC